MKRYSSSLKSSRSNSLRGGVTTFRTLLCATLATLSIGSAYADTNVVLQKDSSTLTLDSLKGQAIPNTDPVQYYPESAYKLEELKDADPENLPKNTVTKYEVKDVTRYYDLKTGVQLTNPTGTEGVDYKAVEEKDLVPKYYQVTLKQTSYGEGDVPKTYGWEPNSVRTERLDFKENPTTPYGGTQITVKYDGVNLETSRLTSPTEDLTKNFVNINGSASAGGAIYNAVANDVNISSDFVGNFVKATASTYNTDVTVYGGAIYNAQDATLGNLTGNYIGNYASSSTSIKSSHVSSYGGAMYNSANVSIGDISGNFIGNYAYASANSGDLYFNSAYTYGGAMYNGANVSIGNITGDFIGNYASSYTTGYGASSTYLYSFGGAIYNNSTAKIGNITGNFIGNYASPISTFNPAQSSSYTSSGTAGASGGAIYNRGTIGDIVGDFVGNYAATSSFKTSTCGGAIYNTGKVGNITGDFIGNYVSNTGTSSYSQSVITAGGAIYNGASAEIGNITGDFIGNYAKGSWSDGGAIYNLGVIGDITGDFIENGGGAVYNAGTIKNIVGNYINNTSSGISNTGTINSITGDFFGNTWHGVYNIGTITTITGDFIENKGGAIGNYSSGTIESITGNFINNTDGAIDSYGKIGTITGDFIGNTGGAISANQINEIKGDFINNSNYYKGGAISGGTIKTITGNFINNKSTFSGGAISSATIDVLNGNFINNYVESTSTDSSSGVSGGALYSTEISNLVGDFVGNYAKAVNGVAQGGAVYNDDSGMIFKETSFFENYAMSENGDAQGGAIFNGSYYSDSSNITLTVQNLTLLNNYTATQSGIASGGALYNNTAGVFNVQDSDIRNNYAKSESGTAQGGAIANTGQMTVSNSNISDNYAKSTSGLAQGGAIYDAAETNLQNVNLINNYAKSESGTALGGAIYSKGTVVIEARDNYTSLIDGNYIDDVNGKQNQAIYMDIEPIAVYQDENMHFGPYYGYPIYKDMFKSLLELNANTNGKIVVNDIIEGRELETILDARYYYDTVSDNPDEKHYIDENKDDLVELPETIVVYPTLKLTGDETGEIYLNNHVKNFDITHDTVTTYVQEGAHLNNNNSLSMMSGSLNISHMGVEPLHFRNLDLVDGNINLGVVDVDLANEKMGRISADTYKNVADAQINVYGMNLTSDAKQDSTSILFADNAIKGNVNSYVSSVPGDAQAVAYTPIYKYNVTYSEKEDGGYFDFVRPTTAGTGGSDGGTVAPVVPVNPSEDFNPAVLGSSTSATAGAIGTMNQTFNYAFQNSTDFMTIPYLERVSMKNANKYALSPTGDATDVGTFSPLFTKQETSSVWVKPYASFENIPLKNGPKVSNITYGTLMGFDSEMEHLKRGWDRVWTGYIGYNGASQRYSGVDSTQNGGLVGATLTMYKNNFFNATTISAGASVANNRNMYGSEDFTMLLAGIGNKTGYNFEFKEGKYIIQPNMLISYTFVNTFDYTNAAGVKIDTKPLNAIQLAPGVKFIGNFKNGWQPYIGVNMIWNLMGKSDTTANGVKLPEMSIKPYVQYGVGLQKRFKDNYMAYGQAMIQNGGRNGISLTAGFRWALGKDGKPIQKVQKQRDSKVVSESRNNEMTTQGARKVLKQLSSEQKTILGKKQQNTTRTVIKGVLKQL